MNELSLTRVTIVASGSGTTADAFAAAIHEGKVNAEIGLVISTRENAGILERVDSWQQRFGFSPATAIINAARYPAEPQPVGQTGEESRAMRDKAIEHRTGLLLLLGCMRILGEPVLNTFGYLPGKHTSPLQARTLNTHPAILPWTKGECGEGASAKALECYRAGLITKSQHTLHVVELGVDEGPTIVTHDVPIYEDDTPASLNERAQLVEKSTIGYGVDLFLRRQIAYRAATKLPA